MSLRALAASCVLLAALASPAAAEDLFRNNNWASMSADRRATSVGDALTVVIFQQAEASNAARTSTSRRTNVGGSIDGAGINESAEIGFGGTYAGGGETRRSERLVAQITVVVQEVLPNGDFVVGGEQALDVNGEHTLIGVRGRVRQADITSDNRILSSRIANAEIDYNGRGFVSRSARPGLIGRIFSFLGLL
jgi:flagellar L-ring protein precursor FlgH